MDNGVFNFDQIRETGELAYSTAKIPEWIGDRLDKEGGVRGGIFDTGETEFYIKERGLKSKKDSSKIEVKEGGSFATFVN